MNNITVLSLYLLISTLCSCGPGKTHRNKGMRRQRSKQRFNTHHRDTSQSTSPTDPDNKISKQAISNIISQRDTTTFRTHMAHIKTLPPSECTDIYIQCISSNFNQGIQELIQNSIPYDQPSKQDQYPLYYAIEQDNYTATKLLLDSGALDKAYTEQNVSILFHSFLYNKDSNIYQLLKSRGAYFYYNEYKQVVSNYKASYEPSPSSKEYIQLLKAEERIFPDLDPEEETWLVLQNPNIDLSHTDQYLNQSWYDYCSSQGYSTCIEMIKNRLTPPHIPQDQNRGQSSSLINNMQQGLKNRFNKVLTSNSPNTTPKEITTQEEEKNTEPQQTFQPAETIPMRSPQYYLDALNSINWDQNLYAHMPITLIETIVTYVGYTISTDYTPQSPAEQRIIANDACREAYTIGPGLNLEGKCENPNCEANGRLVWCLIKGKKGMMYGQGYDEKANEIINGINIGDRRGRCTCPVCHQSVESRTVLTMGFYKCYYDILGISYKKDDNRYIYNTNKKTDSSTGFVRDKIIELYSPFVSTRPLNYREIKAREEAERRQIIEDARAKRDADRRARQAILRNRQARLEAEEQIRQDRQAILRNRQARLEAEEQIRQDRQARLETEERTRQEIRNSQRDREALQRANRAILEAEEICRRIEQERRAVQASQERIQATEETIRQIRMSNLPEEEIATQERLANLIINQELERIMAMYEEDI